MGGRREEQLEKLVSVIIPVYNTERHLDKCIKSVISQSYPDIEIILIDDGSTDSSAEICDMYEKKDDRIKTVHKNNEGVIIARDVGVSMATGEFISFLDSDDWIDKNYYERLLEKFYEYPEADIVIGGWVAEEQNGESICRFNHAPERLYKKTEAIQKMIEFKIFGWNLVDKIYRKELFSKKYQWKFTHQMGEDLELNWFLFNNASYILFYPLYGYHYVMHDTSNMHTPFSVAKLSDLDRLNFMIEETTDRVLLSLLSRKFFNIAQNHILEMFRSYGTYEKCCKKYQTLLRKHIQNIELNEHEKKIYRLLELDYNDFLAFYKGKVKNLKEHFVSFSSKFLYIYIYGAGVYGKRIVDFFIKNNLSFSGIVTTRQTKDKFYRGHRIIPFDKILSPYCNCGFILGMNAKNTEQVIGFLMERGATNYLSLREDIEILDLVSFLGDYYEQ